jgi:hypothetical protein
MRAWFHSASDWIYILLADSQRSPVVLMFEKRTGSPLRFRTCDPSVNNAREKCFVIRDDMFSRCERGEAKALVGSTKLILLCNASAMCSVAYFCCCNGKWVVSCCSCRHSCAWACKGSSADHVCFRWILLVQELCCEADFNDPLCAHCR